MGIVNRTRRKNKQLRYQQKKGKITRKEIVVSPECRNAECEIVESGDDWTALSPIELGGSIRTQEEYKIITVIGREVVLIVEVEV
tara:strand:+ start:48875 stop:49129 length:255 start_codon:yes stop_codon:yes gene_type:complete